MKKIIACLLALLLVCSLFGCGNTPAAPTTQATEPAVTNVYTQAAAPLRDAQNLKISLTTQKDITALSGTFSYVSQQELTLTGIGTDTFTAAMNEELTFGEYDDKFTECFADDTLYLNVYDIGYFQGDMSETDFLSRFAPAVLLDETLYNDVSSQASDSGVSLIFSDPTGPEAWALPQGAKFLSAGGTANITQDGVLTESVYTLDYIQGSTTVSLQVTAKAEIYEGAAIEAPQNPYRYNKIDDIEAPRLFDMAILYLYNSETVSSDYYQVIVSQAANYVQMEQAQLHYTGTGKDHISSIQTTFSSGDNATALNTSITTEKFENGQYTYSENGGAPVPDSGVKAEDMVAYLQNYGSEGIPALNYVTSVKLEDVNGLTYLEMELNPEWGKYTAKNISYALFQDADFLDGYATDYETTTAIHRMYLDPATGFPLTTGTTYAGNHTIEGQKYLLTQETTHSIRLADSSTYTELTGNILPETAPAEQATPLLYRVTGAEGQQMYLMGTIHVGDVKTGFLPEEVYSAFEASDALAVEADILDFEEKAEADPQLATQLAALFVNPGGSATKDQLDAPVYELALQLLRASGDYSANMEYMKPYVWTSSIENFYLTLGGLRSEKGMDERLLRLAKEQDKKILEVESALFQYEMFAGFSDDLQELLLELALESTAAEYCEEVQSMYDLWCAGDEAALRQMLAEDASELNADEQVLYEEYITEMIIQRNDNMLDVAVSYLEGEDTVFFAVGLAHLLQENGLVDTLREAGYTVEQVAYN